VENAEIASPQRAICVQTFPSVCPLGCPETTQADSQTRMAKLSFISYSSPASVSILSLMSLMSPELTPLFLPTVPASSVVAPPQVMISPHLLIYQFLKFFSVLQVIVY